MSFTNKKIKLKELEEAIEVKLKAGELDKAEWLAEEMVRVAESDDVEVDSEQIMQVGTATKKKALPIVWNRRKSLLSAVSCLVLALIVSLPLLFATRAEKKEDVPTYTEFLLDSTGRIFAVSSHSEAEHYYLIQSYLKRYGDRLFKTGRAQHDFMRSACAISDKQQATIHQTPSPLQEAPNARVGRQLDSFAQKVRS